ncbi:MAG: nucleotidyltransferase domain-containing protein [Actinomycetota bacterium]|nr:nucleotidyltransferase domain-containing protein [Actinomycetota bacterium]
MSNLHQLAREIGAPERTLRRAVAEGALRCHRPGPRRLEVDAEEVAYLTEHWPLLAQLRAALRTEPRVRFAALYGSVARGEERPGSDIDLLVALDDDRPTAASALGLRLRRQIGREVDIALLDDVEQRAPLLALQAIDDGRVLVDRDQCWLRLHSRRAMLAQRAEADFAVRMQAAAQAAGELMAG